MGFTWDSHGNSHENVPKTHIPHVQSTRFTCAESHVYVATCAFAHVKFMWFFCKGIPLSAYV